MTQKIEHVIHQQSAQLDDTLRGGGDSHSSKGIDGQIMNQSDDTKREPVLPETPPTEPSGNAEASKKELTIEQLSTLLARSLPVGVDEDVDKALDKLKLNLQDLHRHVSYEQARSMKDLVDNAIRVLIPSKLTEATKGSTGIVLSTIRTLISQSRPAESGSESDEQVTKNIVSKLKSDISSTYDPKFNENEMGVAQRLMAIDLLGNLGFPVSQEEQDQRLEEKLRWQAEHKKVLRFGVGVNQTKVALGIADLGPSDRVKRVEELYPPDSGIDVNRIIDCFNVSADATTAEILKQYQGASIENKAILKSFAERFMMELPEEAVEQPNDEAVASSDDIVSSEAERETRFNVGVKNLMKTFKIETDDLGYVIAQKIAKAYENSEGVDLTMAKQIYHYATEPPYASREATKEKIIQWRDHLLNADGGDNSAYFQKNVIVLEAFATVLGIPWEEITGEQKEKVEGDQVSPKVEVKAEEFINPYPLSTSPSYEQELAESYLRIRQKIEKSAETPKLELAEQALLYAYAIKNNGLTREEALNFLYQQPIESLSSERIPVIARDINLIMNHFITRVETGEKAESVINNLQLGDLDLKILRDYPLYLAADVILRWMQTDQRLDTLKEVSLLFANRAGTEL